MPERTLAPGRTLWRLMLFSLLSGALVLLGGAPGRRSARRPTGPIWPKPIEPDATACQGRSSARADHGPHLTRSRRRFAASLAFATLFFAGAAESAGAGNVVVDLLESNDPAVEEVPSEEEADPAE